VLADPERDSEDQGTMPIGGSAVDPDMTGWSDRLEVPGIAPPSKQALDVGKIGPAEPNLAMGPSADPDRPDRQLEHPYCRVATTLNMQESRFRHRGAVSCVHLVRASPGDPSC
jgi:hypothetical protein